MEISNDISPDKERNSRSVDRRIDPQAEGVLECMRGPLSFSSYYEVYYMAHQKCLGRRLVTWQ
jgi:hypothetical protein